MAVRVSKKWWGVVTGAILVLTGMVAARNLLHAISIKREINALEREKRYYLKQIEADSVLLERLKYDDFLEEYARERFRMQRRDEQVYIVAED